MALQVSIKWKVWLWTFNIIVRKIINIEYPIYPTYLAYPSFQVSITRGNDVALMLLRDWTVSINENIHGKQLHMNFTFLLCFSNSTKRTIRKVTSISIIIKLEKDLHGSCLKREEDSLKTQF